MKERPILFSGAMVRALIAGTKTQTRRVVALPRSRSSFVLVRDHKAHTWWPYQSDDGESHLCDDGCEQPYASPYGLPGDRLWVRESFRGCRAYEVQGYPPRDWGNKPVWFEADGAAPGRPDAWATKARPSIHMPRWASRLLLEVTEVRVERLQDISEADCIAEGIEKTAYGFWSLYGQHSTEGTYSPRSSYRALWESINGPGGWDANPWIWVVSFRVITPITALDAPKDQS